MFAELPGTVSICEVSPRDGLQNEEARLSVEARVALIEQLADAGFADIEVGSFVRPEWIPQLVNTRDVLRQLSPREHTRYWALIPNTRGLTDALNAGLRHAAFFMSSSEAHNKANINRTIAESLQEQRALIGQAKKEGLKVRAYLSTVFGCPYEGKVDPERVVHLAQELFEAGADAIALGDTIGCAQPLQVEAMVQRVAQVVPRSCLILHFHDTRGLALANVMAGLASGIHHFDASMAGMGGCPYATGAAGNLATEDLLYLLEGLGIHTGVSLSRAARVGIHLASLVGRPLPGRYHQYFKGAWEQESASSCASCKQPTAISP